MGLIVQHASVGQRWWLVLGNCSGLKSLTNSFQGWSAICSFRVYKVGCNEHPIGEPNCHADHQRDRDCGEIQMCFQKLSPQQEERKFFGGPVKAPCGGMKDSICYLDWFLAAWTVNTERECPVIYCTSPLSEQPQFPPSSNYDFAWMTLKSEHVPLGNKLGKCSPFHSPGRAKLFCSVYFSWFWHFLILFRRMNSSLFLTKSLLELLSIYPWYFSIGYIENKLHKCKFQPGIEHYVI